MGNKQLTKQEIEALFRFCAQHGVKYYDVQVELIDHLASAIEDKIGQSPYYTFDQCLKEEYHAFGPAGFSKFLSEKKAQVEKSIKKKRIALLQKSFTPPLIFLTLFILCVPIYLIGRHDVANMKKLNLLYLISDVIIGIYWTIQATLYVRQRKKTRSGMQRLKIMLEDVPQVWQVTIVLMALFNSVQGLAQFTTYSNGNGNFYFIAIYLMLSAICSLMLFIFINEGKKIHQHIKQQYPDAFT